jgi:hypothetical protein
MSFYSIIIPKWKACIITHGHIVHELTQRNGEAPHWLARDATQTPLLALTQKTTIQSFRQTDSADSAGTTLATRFHGLPPHFFP